MTRLDAPRWKVLSDLLDQALELDAAARAAWLDRLAVDDAADLRRLLANAAPHTDAKDRAEPFAGLLRDALADDHDADACGLQVGAWTTRRVLGAGGMGTVYLAEREVDGTVQRGALKLVRRGMDSQAILDRFRRERQILTRLAHPSIAPLLDGGISTDGRPYLVMAHIDGVPLDDWSARADVGLHLRCAVILQLCDAVAHAHRLLIVHRDIKPANVLVDANDRAHLLDFGIAKVLADSGPVQHTATVARVLTRAYAAPEQIAGAATSTAVDIFQLGVLLFELLTGARFHDNPDASAGSPTHRLALAREHAGAHGPPQVNARALRGDIGVIVARATDADPARRYATVEAFGEDIRRWRDGRPILARADSATYRIGKFAQRHWIGLAASAAIALALLAGSGIALWQARIARAQAARAEAVNAFLETIFRSIDPANARGREVSAKELIDAGAARIDKELAAQPAAAAQLHATLGQTYFALGDYAKAQAQLRRALALFEPDQAEPIIRATVDLVEVRKASGDLDEAQRLIDAADARRLRALPHDGALADLLLGERASLASYRGDATTALALATRWVDSVRTRTGARSPETLDARNTRAVYLNEAGKSGEAVAEAQGVVDARRQQLGADDPAVAVALHNLASFQSDAGQNDAALASHEEALRIRRKVLPANHPDIARSLGAKANLLSATGRARESIEVWPQVIATLQAQAQPDRGVLAMHLNNWGVACYAIADYACAEQRIGQALAIWRADLPAAHPYVLTAQSNLAALQLQRGDLPGGEARLREIISAREADIAAQGASADKQSGLESSRALLVQSLRYQRRYAEALDVARRAHADATAYFTPPNVTHATALGLLARSEGEAGNFARAAELARQAIEECRSLSPDGGTEEAWGQMTLALALLGDKQAREALAPARRAVDLYAQFSGAQHWRTAEARGVLGMTQAALGLHADARRELDFAIGVLDKDRPYMPIVADLRRVRARLR
ncbi:MAG: tetratricopeptide repeat protein [Proteobacteria bacterium]|nr:tetratricopeptide repeat protein [Pseudomonadota bacterium]